MPQSKSLIRVREPRGAPCCGPGDGASDALWEQGSGNSAHWEGTEAHRIGALQETRLVTGAMRIPPYRSMRLGVNVHLEALDGR